MKRVLLAVLIASILACAVALRPGVITLEAQTLPVTKTFAWDDATAVAEGVTNYTVLLDGVVIGSPTVLTQAVTFTTAGTHTLSVSAVNLWGTSPAATLTVNVIVPSKPSNTRLQ